MNAATIYQSLATLLLSSFFVSIVQAAELDELATTQRLLDQVQLSLDRARTVAAQSDPNNRRRYLFDYKKANEDLNTMRIGINRYTQPSRRSRWIRQGQRRLHARPSAMAMTAAQINAFKTASGNIDISVLYLVSVGLLLCVLFFWAAWAALDVWHGWANTKVRDAALAQFDMRSVALLIVSIWMFTS